MDGYVKNKKTQIKKAYVNMVAKYALSFLLFLGLLLPPTVQFLVPAPAEWEEREIMLASVQKERVGARFTKKDVIVTTDGETFVLPSLSNAQKNALLPGEQYRIVCYRTLSVQHIVGMAKDGAVLIDRAMEAASWERDQRTAYVWVAIAIAAEVLALFLIDRLWCKKEHAQVKKLRQNIANRKARMAKKASA